MASQKQRQKYLDFINANPKCTSADVGNAFGIKPEKAAVVMAQMCDNGELYRERPEGSAVTVHYRYEALITESQPSPPKINVGYDKYHQTSAIRQMILDLANKEGTITGKLVTQNVMWEGRLLLLDHSMRTCNRMAVDGELRKHGKGHGIFFTPLATETMSASALRERQANNKHASSNMPPLEELENVTKRTKRGLIHHGMSRTRPLPFQGAQGSGGYVTGLQSSFSVI